jgi:hypothetical protein
LSRLFDVADVIDGDKWTGPEDGQQRGFGVAYDVQYDAEARPLIVQDICTRANVARVAGSTSASAVVYTIRPFGAMVSAYRPNRCVLGAFPEFDQALQDDLKNTAWRAACYVLYNGMPGWTNAQPFLLNSDVATVATGTTVQDTVPAVLDAFYAQTVGLAPILHLGQTSAVKISAGNALSPSPESDEFYLAMDGTPIVVSPDYPTNLVAATGPIIVHRSKPAILEPAYDYGQNRTYFTADMALTVEFDASTAVRATP